MKVAEMPRIPCAPMAGLHAQSRRKGEKRSVDMSAAPEQVEPWSRPADEECEEEPAYTVYPEGADPALHRVKLRMVIHIESQNMVLFAVVQQTYDRGKWRHVVEVDTCHDVDVHLHQYGRSTDARVGEPEVLAPIVRANDLDRGYEIAYDRVMLQWADNVERWRRG